MGSEPAQAPERGLRHAATKATAWALIETWGNRVITTVVFLFLARALGPKEFGLVALATIFVELGNKIVNSGFGSAIVQRKDLERAHLDTAFWVSVSGGAGLTLLMFLTAPLVSQAFDAPDLTWVLRVLSARFLLDALSNAQQSILQRELRFGSLAIRSTLGYLVGGVAGVALAVGGAGVWALVAQNLIGSTVAVFVLWSVSSWRPGFHASRAHFGDMFGYGANVVGIAVLRFLGDRGEKLLIGAFISPVALGFYTVARRFPDILIDMFTKSLGRVAFPLFSRLQADRERQNRAFFEVVRVSTAVAAPVFIGLAVMAPEIIRALIGERWEESIVLLQLLAVQGLVRSHLFFAGNVVMATGRAGLMLNRTLIEAVMKFVALAIAVPFGVTAVAWAVVGYSIASAPITIWTLRIASDIDLTRYFRQLARPLILASAMGAVVLVVRPALGGFEPLPRLVLEATVAGASYALLLGLFGRDFVREALSALPPAADPRRRIPFLRGAGGATEQPDVATSPVVAGPVTSVQQSHLDGISWESARWP